MLENQADEVSTDKTSWSSCCCSLEKKTCSLGFLCARESKNLDGLVYTLTQMRAHLLFCRQYWDLIHTRETHPDILARNTNTFWCQNGCEKRLKELDLSNWLCGKTVLSSLSVNSLEAEDLSSTILGCGWQRKHVVRVFLGTLRVWNLLSPGIISKGYHENLISWYTDLNWKCTGVSSEKSSILSATGKDEDVKIDLDHPPFPSCRPQFFCWPRTLCSALLMNRGEKGRKPLRAHDSLSYGSGVQLYESFHFPIL